MTIFRHKKDKRLYIMYFNRNIAEAKFRKFMENENED
jgi:hypothetical protein